MIHIDYDPLVDIDLPAWHPSKHFFDRTQYAVDRHWAVYAGPGAKTHKTISYVQNPIEAAQVARHLSQSLSSSSHIDVDHYNGHGPIGQTLVWRWVGRSGDWTFDPTERELSAQAWVQSPRGWLQKPWADLVRGMQLSFELWALDYQKKWMCFYSTHVAYGQRTYTIRTASLEEAREQIEKWKRDVIIDPSTHLAIHNPVGVVWYAVQGTRDWEWKVTVDQREGSR